MIVLAPQTTVTSPFDPGDPVVTTHNTVRLPTAWPSSHLQVYVNCIDATPGGVADTLDVYLQTTLDGTNWFDVAAWQFTDTDDLKRVFTLSSSEPQALFTAADAALASNTTRHIFAHRLRLKTRVTNNNLLADASFTYSAQAEFI